jgi:hypothetical protein
MTGASYVDFLRGAVPGPGGRLAAEPAGSS